MVETKLLELRKYCQVSLMCSGSVKVQLEVAAKACAIVRNHLFETQLAAFKAGDRQPMSSDKWCNTYLPRLKSRVGFGILNNLPNEVHRLTATNFNRLLRDAFRSGKPERFPKIPDSNYDHIRFGSLAHMDAEASRIYFPKLDWIRFYKRAELANGLPGDVKKITVFREGNSWNAYIMFLCKSVVSEGAYKAMKRYAKDQPNLLEEPKSSWVEDLHTEREQNLK